LSDSPNIVTEPAPAPPTTGGPARVSDLRRAVSRGAAAALLLRASGLAAAGLASLVAARELGAAGYGTYAWAYALATALAVPAALGADQLLTREAGVAVDHGDWAGLRTLVRSALRWVGLSAAGAAALGAVVVLLTAGGNPGARGTALLVALPIVPLAGLLTVAQGTLLGLGRTARALAPGLVARPAAFLLLVAIAVAATGLSAPGAVALQLVAVTGSAALGLVLLSRSLPREGATAGAITAVSRVGARPRDWMRVSLPMGASAIFLALDAQVGLLVLGAVGHAADAGYYAAAVLCTAPFALLLAAGRLPLGPVIARLAAAGERERLQRGLRLATRAVGAACALVAAILLVIPATVLDLFGAEFSSGADALRILAVAQLVNALCAFNGVVLIMGGHERAALRAAVCCLAIDIVLCAVLVPPFGEVGAAIAVLVGITARNVANSVATRRLVGVDSTVLGRMTLRRGGPTRR
jgi:O-antigen/teichoic acid export membrane protein